MNLTTLAAAKRTIKPGVTLAITNHARPQASRIATVLKAQTKSFSTTADGAPHGSWTNWPKAAHFRGEGNVFHLLGSDGEPWITYRVLEAAEVPA